MKKEEGKDLELEDDLDEEVIELIDEDGNTVKFYHVATIDYKEDWFVFFTPAQEVEEVSEDEVVIFKLGLDDEGKDVFLPIEDEKLLNEVYEEYVKLMEQEMDGEGEGCGCGCGEDNCDDEGCDCDDDSCSGCGHEHGKN